MESAVFLQLLQLQVTKFQCWTKGRSSTAIAKDLRPIATATVAEIWPFLRPKVLFVPILRFFSKMEAEMHFLYTGATKVGNSKFKIWPFLHLKSHYKAIP